MGIIDECRAAGLPVWDGTTPHKCFACDFATANPHDMAAHMIEKHPKPPGVPLGQVGELCTSDPVLQRTINRCVRALFTGDHADGLAAIREHEETRRKN